MDTLLGRGIVIRKFFEEMRDTQKIKLGVIIGQTPRLDQLLFLFIGSKQFRGHDWNIPVGNHDYPFLDHLSYLYCGDVTPVLSEKVRLAVQANPKMIVGQLTATHMEKALALVQACPTVKTKHKKFLRMDWQGVFNPPTRRM